MWIKTQDDILINLDNAYYIMPHLDGITAYLGEASFMLGYYPEERVNEVMDLLSKRLYSNCKQFDMPKE